MKTLKEVVSGTIFRLFVAVDPSYRVRILRHSYQVSAVSMHFDL